MPTKKAQPANAKSGPSPVLRVRVDADLRARVAAKAKERGVNESEFLRVAITREVDQPSAGVPAPAPEPGAVTEPLERITVRFPERVEAAAREHAAARGMALSRWVSRLIQVTAMRQPVLTTSEQAAVEEASRELAAIGRNINQIARALNFPGVKTDRVRLTHLEELGAAFEQTRKRIRELVRASNLAWGQDESH